MMYGHVDHPGHWVNHLQALADIQRETGGFTEFVPLPFVHQSSPIYLAGVARPGPTVRDNRAVHAMARIMLHGLIDNIQCSWVKLGPEQLHPGAERRRQRPRRHADGGDHQPHGRLHQRLPQGRRRARGHGRAAGRPARQRTTHYGRVDQRRDAAVA